MNKLILVMVLLFSATATAENLKYKRGNSENMLMHIKCHSMAKSIKLSAARIGVHASEALGYFYRDKEMAGSEAMYTDVSNYQIGWVDGLFSTLDASERNGVYYAVCQEDTLLFSLRTK